MRLLGPRSRRSLLIVHIAVSVGWMGAILAYVAINAPLVLGADEPLQRAAYVLMPVVMRLALIPLAVATVITGVALSLGTKWRLFEYYWVVVSLAVTVVAAVVLVLHVPAVDALAAVASQPRSDISVLGNDLVHALGGLIVLTVPLVLNVVKPKGLTRYGWRRQQARARATAPA
jgi:cytochrome bd-type quinol oxidase subunit 2